MKGSRPFVLMKEIVEKKKHENKVKDSKKIPLTFMVFTRMPLKFQKLPRSPSILVERCTQKVYILVSFEI